MKQGVLIVLIYLLSGCSTISWYSQSIGGHLKIVLKQQPIEELLEQPSLDDKLKKRLLFALDVRKFASQKLHLPDNQSFTDYADLGRKYVVWNIIATPELSLTPQTWCYPIAGCASYRGYYSLKKAQAKQIELQQQGLDVYISRVPAYSTLGWFNDPVLNTFIHWRDYQFAGLIFHELSHQITYIKNDTAFNESFAHAVELLGTLQWLKQQSEQATQEWMTHNRSRKRVMQLKTDIHNELEALYQSKMTEQQKKEEKQRIMNNILARFDQTAMQEPGINAWRKWFAEANNNAWFTASFTYEKHLPAFFQLFKETDGRWPDFYKAVKKLAKLSSSERELRLAKLGTSKLHIEDFLNKPSRNMDNQLAF